MPAKIKSKRRVFWGVINKHSGEIAYASERKPWAVNVRTSRNVYEPRKYELIRLTETPVPVKRRAKKARRS